MPTNVDTYRALRAWRAENSSYHRKRDKARATEDWYSTDDPGFTVSESFSERIGQCLCDMRMSYGKMERLEDELRELKRQSAGQYARLFLVIGDSDEEADAMDDAVPM